MGWHGNNQQAQEIIISRQVGTTHLPAVEGTNRASTIYFRPFYGILTEIN